MAPFLRNVTFSSVNLYEIYQHDILLASKIFEHVMSLMRQSIVQVKPITIYKYSQMKDPFVWVLMRQCDYAKEFRR